MGRDWLFSENNQICGFRAAGVLIRGDKLFVQREKGSDEYALPGGHVKIGETSEDALIREYKEETGVDITCNRLIWVEESFWNWGRKSAHTIVFYHLISLENESEITDEYFELHKDNCNVLLQWVPIDEVKNLTIYPNFIKNKINMISNNIEHFISFE